MKVLKDLIALIAAMLCLQGAAFASYGVDEIVIMDVTGVVRYVSKVDRPATIEFTIVDAAGMPADGVQIILKSEAGEEFTRVSAQGTAVFEEITPGIWTVSTASPDVTFTGIVFTNIAVDTAYAAAAGGSIAAAASIFEGGGAAVAGGVAVTGGAIAISYSAGDKSDHDLSPHR